MRLNLVILAAFVLAGYGLTLLFDHAPPPVQPQQSATEFSFRDINHKTHRLSDFKGKTVILNFWASWCAPCVLEFPRLLAAAKKYPDDVVFIALSSDTDEKAITKFLTQQKLDTSARNIYIALDEHDIAGTKFKTFRLPETYILNRAQNITGKLVGADWTPKDLEIAITKGP